MDAEIAANGAGRLRVASFRPRALIGEIAYYALIPRTAWVVARTRAVLLQIDLDALEACDSAGGQPLPPPGGPLPRPACQAYDDAPCRRGALGPRFVRPCDTLHRQLRRIRAERPRRTRADGNEEPRPPPSEHNSGSADDGCRKGRPEMTNPTIPMRPLAKTHRRLDARGLLSLALHRLIESDRRYREARRLRDIPDHVLDDIGIGRGDIDRMLDHWPRH